MKYIPVCSLFLCNNEILSYLALCIIACFLVYDLVQRSDDDRW